MVGPNKQTSIDTHTRVQCSHASVGLVQARPNKINGHNHEWFMQNGSGKYAYSDLKEARAKTGETWAKSVYVPCNLRICTIARLRGSFSSQLEV